MKKRNLMILASSTLFAASLFAVSLFAGTATLKTTVASAETTDFQMVYGASVRTKADSTGIRFMARLTEEKYAEVVGNADKKFGMLIVPTEYLSGAQDADKDGTPDYVEHIQNNYTAEIDGETVTPGLAKDLVAYFYNVDDSADGSLEICISASVIDLQFKNMNRDFTGIGFIETATMGEDGTVSYSYEYAAVPDGETEYCSRNITYVASVAYADSEEREKHGDVLKGFVENGIKQAAGLTEADKTPDVSVSLNKTEIPYLSNTQVAVEYKANETVLDIDLYSEIKTDSALATLQTGNVLAPLNQNDAPETVAANTEAGIDLQILCPALSLDAYTQNVKIVCEYTESVTAAKVAVRADEAFDMGAYLQKQGVTLNAGDEFDSFRYSNNAKPYIVTQTAGVFTLSDGSIVSVNTETSQQGKIIDDVALGQNIYEISAFVKGENENMLKLVTVSVVFFDLNTVLEKGLVATNDNAYSFVEANGGWAWNSYGNATIVTVEEGELPFGWGVTAGTFIKIPRHFDYHVYMNFPSQYDKAVLLWLHEQGYELHFEMTNILDETQASYPNNWCDFYSGENLNIRTDGKWQPVNVSLANFAAIEVGSIPSKETTYHFNMRACSEIAGAKDYKTIGYLYIQVPQFVKKA